MSETLDSPAAQDQPESDRPRLLIEDWLPIGALGEESVRERRSMTALPPTYYLHVWWARRPLVASRAAILGSLLPASADRDKFMHVLGIHGDPVATKEKLTEAKRTGANLGLDPYGYKRAFTYKPDPEDLHWATTEFHKTGVVDPVVLDPTAGGGSIPFEAVRLGANTIANDLNPVAWMILKATVEFPKKYGTDLLNRYEELAKSFCERAEKRFQNVFPAEEENTIVIAYLWARTVTCPYCSGLVPLSPNWKLDGKGTGVKIVPQLGTGTGDPSRHCTYEIVQKATQQSPGTVKGGNAVCPYPDCTRPIDGDVIKKQAQEGKMGQQLYAVVYNRLIDQGRTKAGKPKRPKKVRGFRAPRPEDDNQAQVQAALDAKMPEWLARGIVPDEDIPDGLKTNEPLRYGMKLWRDMFSPRQLLGHGISVEVFHEIADELGPEISDLDRAAMVYLAISLDKVVSYNSILSRWDVVREAIRGKFDRHDYAFLWSYGEMAPCIAGLGYDWAVEQTGKSLKELVELITGTDSQPDQFEFNAPDHSTSVSINHGSASSLALADHSIDSIVMDPPYYDNVMYAELSDFFYVWLKRTAGRLFPEAFYPELTDKENEAVANPAKFKGEKSAKKQAYLDYRNRMASIFKEGRRVLKPQGAMVLMFTHKASGAWDALATGLVEADFAITASWPVNTEAEGSLHIKEKSAAKSTIFLVCRPKATEAAKSEPTYWEDIEPQVTHKVRERLAEFQAGGITGVDLYLACFGPALQVFSEAWPLTRGTPVPEPKDWDPDLFKTWDPYCVRPEDALDAARREVKRWRMDQLATITRQHHLDELTEFFILAWDAFRAPRFPADEALKLARVVGLDFDRDLKNVVCEVKGGDVILWDSKIRQAKGKLGPVSQAIMLDTLHHAALASHAGNTGTAKEILERAKLLDDPTLKAALQAMLNVLPPIKGSDFEALHRLRNLAFPTMDVSEAQLKLYEQTSLAVIPNDVDEEAEEE